MKTLFELDFQKNLKESFYVQKDDINLKDHIPLGFIRENLNIPDLTEWQVVRHFTNLSNRNFGVDNGFYPLGSCTMKYNPKINEELSSLTGFSTQHPLFPEEYSQGTLKALYDLCEYLKKITGMDAVSLQPSAGANGEHTGLAVIKEYFLSGKEERREILTVDSSHGTNAASCTGCGFDLKEIKSNSKGMVDLALLKENLSENTAAVMLTVPNTLGIFEKDIKEICETVHKNGSFCYMDGANFNAVMGIVNIKKAGVDVVHLNLHKTFSTPHGGGGPGSGPVLVVDKLKEFLPVPVVEKNKSGYFLNKNLKNTVGKVHSFYGNIQVCLKALCYILSLGFDGLKQTAEYACLNADYLRKNLEKDFNISYASPTKHEFVLRLDNLPNGIKALHFAKRLLDYGVHPPTVYFPLIVKEAFMIEPTETENKETMDRFIDIMRKIKNECFNSPEKVLNAPLTMPVKRADEVFAAKSLLRKK